ncbi:MAG: M28 family peptidase [Candidatus Helarchaeota archaeon]
MAKGKKRSAKKKRTTKKQKVKKKPETKTIKEEPEEAAAKPEKEPTVEEKVEIEEKVVAASEPTETPAPVEKPEKKPQKPKKEIEEIEEGEVDQFERLEYKDTFDKNRAYKHVESLTFPRMVGTEGEKKAAKYIKNKFSEIGLNPIEEQFTFTDWASKVFLRVYQGIEVLLLIIAVLLITPDILAGTILTALNPGFIAGMILACILIGMLFYGSIGARFFYKYQNTVGKPKILQGTQYTSSNIIAKIDCKRGSNTAAGDVIIIAHYDSKSQRWPLILRVLLFYIELVISLIATIGFISFYTLILAGVPMLSSQTIFLTVLWSCVGINLGIWVIFLLNKTTNNSPGALDNASGVGVFLELAENFSKDPLENLNLTFLATGAEELGLMGAVAFMKTHESEYDKDETYFINLKITGVRGNLYIPGPVGFPPRLPCLLIETLYKKALKRRQIPIKEGSSKIIKVSSPWVFGNWNDDMIPILRSFNANRVSIGGFLKKYSVIHTAKDTLDNIDSDALEIIGKVTAEVLTRLDLRARP